MGLPLYFLAQKLTPSPNLELVWSGVPLLLIWARVSELTRLQQYALFSCPRIHDLTPCHALRMNEPLCNTRLLSLWCRVSLACDVGGRRDLRSLRELPGITFDNVDGPLFTGSRGE